MSQSTSEVFEVREDTYAQPAAALTHNHNENPVFEVREDTYVQPAAALTHNHNEVLVEG
ncbi:hypothetical protein AB0D33_26760 [Streptomyces sp. NPDC048404]|uniref:hypothetical protein n=1 Tax=unclassified Streptomyces TaxID=2593676 RepID=UPI0034151B54